MSGGSSSELGQEPRTCLQLVPPLSEAPTIAASLRRQLSLRQCSPLDVDRMVDSFGITVVERGMRAARGGVQGLLIPSAEGFRVEIDAEPRGGWQSVRTDLRPSLRRHRRRFLICHEVAHTLFYESRGDRPTRRFPGSEIEERFCDELARSLLVPVAVAGDLAPSPESAVRLQKRFDVSLQVALRSLATAHGGLSAWLLLSRPEGVRIQWTSASRSETADALPALRELGRRTSLGSPAARLAAGGATLAARLLERRGQMVVTAGDCVL